MPDTTATDQYQMLRAIWPQWRAIATSTSGSIDYRRAEAAVTRLYRFYDCNDPSISWLDSLHRLPFQHFGTPMLVHMRETLIYSVWHKLRQPHWVCTQLGYNPHDGTFQLPFNKQLLMSQAVVPRGGRRPVWMLNADNIISQFDVDALAIQQLAGEAGIAVEAKIRELAAIITELVQTTFAVIAFEESCLLITKPRKVILNELQQLSAQGETVFESFLQGEHGISSFCVYAHNRRIISINKTPDVSYARLNRATSPERLALIEYMGWEAFFRLMGQHGRLSPLGRDTYGNLFLIQMGLQEFVVVEVRNKTREPNGRFRRYVIPVDRECRPLPNPLDPRGRLGEPQALTPLNAVASTFGMTGPQYVALLGRES